LIGDSAGSRFAFADRYLLARFPTGGVIVDLASGNYFRVNASAALICEALRAAEEREDAVWRLASELAVSSEEAAKAVTEVVAALSIAPVHGDIQGSYHFYPNPRGYGLWHGERCVLEVDRGDLCIRLGSDAKIPTGEQLELYVRALAPKLLFHEGITVLHASACLINDRTIAFAGLSGAGKTTTAHAFRDAGSQLLSEDLVVLVTQNDRAQMLVDGELFIQRWARRVATDLLAEPGRSVSPEALGGVVQGAIKPLQRILFLDRNRRAGTEFVLTELEEPDALVGLLTHDFLGAGEIDMWRRYFEGAVGLMHRVEMRQATAPDGVERLVAAAARYTSSTAS
jgi:hypothetical protein